jgi:excisionase family DNA binding protein
VSDFEQYPTILTMRDVIQITRPSRDLAYRLAHRKDFPAVRFGRAIRVSREAFFKWLERQMVTADEAPRRPDDPMTTPQPASVREARISGGVAIIR